MRFSKKLAYLPLLLLLSFFIPLKAQVPSLAADTLSQPAASCRIDSAAALDSLHLIEANLKLEVERLQALHGADSLRRQNMRRRIDSLRAVTPGAAVVVEKDTLFFFYAKQGATSPQNRATMAASEITKAGSRFLVNPDQVYVESSEIFTDVMYEDHVLVTLTDVDGLWAGCHRDSLASEIKTIVSGKLEQMKEEHSLATFIWRCIMFVGVILAIILAIRIVNILFRKLKEKILGLKDTKMRPLLINNYELLDTDHQVSLLCKLSNLLRWVVDIVVLIVMVPFMFAIFPQTESVAQRLFSYILNPLRNIAASVIDYIPNFFTIAVIWLVTRYLLKFIKYLASEVEAEKLKLKGFYPDWAMPTYHIVRFLLYAFMIATIYPYLPGSESGVFQGISVFLGLIVSLGSSAFIGNIISGLVITYMRPFKMGDRIQLDQTNGNVIEKTPLVTRIKTPKNEIVTVPNSFIMSSKTVNYSASAREFGLIIHTEVTIGYDAPWRLVNQLLIDSALMTPGILSEPAPFVLETALSDWYPVYQLNAYIRDANNMGEIYSKLHENIQDSFNAAGVEIMSPHYMATRDGNASTIPTNANQTNEVWNK